MAGSNNDQSVRVCVRASVPKEVFRVFFYTVSYRNLKLFMRFFWVVLHTEFVFHCRDPYDSGPGYVPLDFFTIGHMHVMVFRVFFYTVSYMNLKLSMRFFWVKVQIEFAFYRRDPYGSVVICPWIFFYYRTYACNSFPWIFFYTVSYRNLKLFMKFFWVKLHFEFAFHLRDPNGSGVTCLWILFYYRTYACNSFPSAKAGRLVMVSTTPASSCFCSNGCSLNLEMYYVDFLKNMLTFS
jgi:hypothetical protein